MQHKTHAHLNTHTLSITESDCVKLCAWYVALSNTGLSSKIQGYQIFSNKRSSTQQTKNTHTHKWFESFCPLGCSLSTKSKRCLKRWLQTQNEATYVMTLNRLSTKKWGEKTRHIDPESGPFWTSSSVSKTKLGETSHQILTSLPLLYLSVTSTDSSPEITLNICHFSLKRLFFYPVYVFLLYFIKDTKIMNKYIS